MKHTLTLSQAEQLSALLNDAEFTYSQVNKNLRSKLEEHNAIRPTRKGQKVRLYLADGLHACLRHYYNIPNLSDYIEELNNPLRTGASAINSGLDSKATKVKPLSGMYLSSGDDVKLLLNDKEYRVNTPMGSSFFIQKDYQKLTIDENILIVIVENAENLLRAQAYRHLFQTDKKILFIYRSYVHEWLKSINNEIIHFGDIDLAGIEIYLNEISPCINHDNHQFFIPEGVEALLKNGNRNLYDKQIVLSRYQNLKSSHKGLQKLIDLIYKSQRGLEQQGFIK